MKTILIVPLVVLTAASCSDSSPTVAVGEQLTIGGTQDRSAMFPADHELVDPGLRLGDPLPGLTQAELDAFERGREVFDRRFTPEEGLGPLYNASSCSSCHSVPVMGGGTQLYRNFYIAVMDFGIGQAPLSGLPSVIVPAFGQGPHATSSFTLEGKRREIPATQGGFPVISAQRNSIPLFGVGLFEFISDATIVSNTDPNDADGDRISGRYNVDAASGGTGIVLGRFGVKSQANNIEVFTRGPLQNQMGITSDPFLGGAGLVSLCSSLLPQGGTGADTPTFDADGVADPEISTQDLGDLIAFTRFLAPPQPKRFNQDARAGEQLFDSLGCTACHIPSLPSSRGPVRAYTDLLLHDLGPANADGIHFGDPQASSIDGSMTTQEFRTAPLWGVSHFGPWLHDGSAGTLRDAIEAHDGEASLVIGSWNGLSETDKARVITFLEHL